MIWDALFILLDPCVFVPSGGSTKRSSIFLNDMFMIRFYYIMQNVSEKNRLYFFIILCLQVYKSEVTDLLIVRPGILYLIYS